MMFGYGIRKENYFWILKALFPIERIGFYTNKILFLKLEIFNTSFVKPVKLEIWMKVNPKLEVLIHVSFQSNSKFFGQLKGCYYQLFFILKYNYLRPYRYSVRMSKRKAYYWQRKVIQRYFSMN